MKLKTKLCTAGVINESPEEREAFEKLMSNYNEPKRYNPLHEAED